MIFEGCQGKKDITLEEKKCPRCGHDVEIFSVDTEVHCEHCGFVIYNDALNCVQWCEYARKCVGDEMYEHMMALAESQKARRQAAKGS